MADKVKFWPIRGTYAQIMNQPYYDGKIYFAYDTNQIILDVKGSKHVISGGGSGTGVVYANGTDQTITKESQDSEDDFYLISFDALENSSIEPMADQLILNSDGRFFRVKSVDSTGKIIRVQLLAVSGTSGGGGTVTTSPLTIVPDTSTIGGSFTYITKQHFNIVLTVNTTTEDDEANLLVEFFAESLSSNANQEPVGTIRTIVPIGEPVNLDVANIDYVGSGMTVRITAESAMAEKPAIRIFNNIRFVDMHISKPDDGKDNYISAVTSGNLQLRLAPYGEGLGSAQLHVSIDSVEIESLGRTFSGSELNGTSTTASIPEQSHGMHTIDLWLSATISDTVLNSDPIRYEAAWIRTGEEVPIIWTGEIPELTIQYENAVIPYMVYDPKAGATETEVIFYRNGVKVGESEIKYQSSGWYYWDVTSLYQVGENRFTITCGISSKEVIVNVTSEGSRDLALKNQSSLTLNFDAAGRSSQEVKSSRSTWRSVTRTEDRTAELQNFNWYNNGWQDDQDGYGSYLSVANGASVAIPFKTFTMNAGTMGHTFEIRFRIRNAKKYGTLVTEIPKYYWIDADGKLNNGEDGTQVKTLDQIAAAGGTLYRDEDGNPVMNEKDTTEKVVETVNNVAMKYLNSNNEGFCIGTQEAYFRTAGKTVNVRYKEGEIINISFVVDKPNETLSIYLNGILSGAVNLNNIAPIDMINNSFLVNSEYCDFDLYKFRAYDIALTMPEVIHNYLSDLKNIALYDENQLTDKNDDTKLSYELLVKYNEEHPDAPTMPYAVIDMTGTPTDTDLPHFKGGNKKVRIEFTNPTADYLLKQRLNDPDGKRGISEWQYYTHCPSFVADNVDLNVQGTSSQVYPRRNFKTKFKKAENWNYTLGSLAGQSVAEKYTLSDGNKLSKKWHMDSEALGTNKFTWKIDYMESSGSYNTGFANLMGNSIYSKHPLEDLNLSGVDASVYRTSVYGFPMLVFHKTAENTYTYIGRYNFNLDKSANEYYGFEEEVETPYIDKEWDELNKDKTVKEHHSHPWIKDVAECWELRDNQGTWCSFRYPNDEMREAGFGALTEDSTAENPKLEVSLHFEPRYHVEADPIEAAQKYKTTDDDGNSYVPEYIATTSNQSICDYLRKKLSNFEVMFNWLDSTDTTHATNKTFDTPIEIVVGSTITGDDSVTYEQREENGTTKVYGIFTKDTVEYRRQKFYSEFENHFDKHYCLIYFIMTELLLCYDSRGKNMMMATFGPHEKGGDYIWYPIFYDIDTQLGLNNVGAWLWDYNEDCTENRTFSTGTSVLWTNFYDLFESEIISTYQALRRTRLNYQTIEGAYTCDPEVFTSSYAMRGKRPIVAIGLDEYYKYVLPVTQPWKQQSGDWGVANYLYACQGDRILSRELLINNRLLYMDSKWRGGEFTISTGGMSGIMFRVTANHQNNTSDKYIESETLAAGQEYAKYPVPYIDATPEFYVTPYLDFYVTTFTDEILYQTPESYDVAKYPNGIPTVISPSILNSFKSSSVDQQLNYFAGSPYISSLGDLSTKYVNQVNLNLATRLLDITLGSDVPEYFNNETLDPFNLHTEKEADGRTDQKPLLQKIVLSNMRALQAKLDTRGAGKLQEFRALGTKLQGVTFAEGAPLHTVHLPNTVEALEFVENKNLTSIIRSAPTVLDMVDGVAVYRDPDTYKGLYVQGLTDYDNARAGAGSVISSIKFEGDAFGYDSYELFKNLISLKAGSGRTNRLKASMLNVTWTPYTQVEYGETQQSGVQYYYLTDHSTYTLYESADINDWNSNTLNGRIYTYDSTTNEAIIPNLDLLDQLIADRESIEAGGVNQFIENTEDTIRASVPAITGQLYISNTEDTKIDESLLTSKYGQYWSKLKITAKYVNESYLAKFVQVDMNTKKEVEIETFRYSPAAVTGQRVNELPNKVISAPQTYDFRGWAYEYVEPTDTNAASKLVYDAETGSWTSLANTKVFGTDQTVITLYAVFTQTLYTVHYLNPDGSEITSSKTTYGKAIPDPQLLPTYDPGNLALEEIYSFKGYTKDQSNAILANKNRLSSVLINLNTTYVTEDDVKIYAVYIKQSVYDEPTNTDYFEFSSASYNENLTSPTVGSRMVVSQYLDNTYNVSNGAVINIKSGIHLTGKVSLPTYAPDGRPVISIGSTFNMLQTGNSYGGKDITHVFWYRTDGKEPELRMTENGAFQSSIGNEPAKLVYVELPDTLRYINGSAFFGLRSLDMSLLKLPKNLLVVGNNGFSRAFASGSSTSTLEFPASLCSVGTGGFNRLEKVVNVYFGSKETGSRLTLLAGQNILNGAYPDGNNSITFSSESSSIRPSYLEFWGSSQAQIDNLQTMIDANNGSISLINNADNKSLALADDATV